MQLLPLLVQLLAISTLENPGCEAGFPLPGIWEKESEEKEKAENCKYKKQYQNNSFLTSYSLPHRFRKGSEDKPKRYFIAFISTP